MIFIRDEHNPLVTPEMVKPSIEGFTVVCAFNAGVAVHAGETLLLLRVAEKPPRAPEGFVNVPEMTPRPDGTWGLEVRTLSLDDPRYDFSDPRKVLERQKGNYVYLTSVSHLRLARSRDGVRFAVDETPFIRPDGPMEAFGCEDARITFIDGAYYINYTAVSGHGITTALARTEDFVRAEKLGVIFTTENRDVTIFPERVGGKYYALVRPVPRQIGQAKMWIAASPDLLHWGEFRPLDVPVYDWSDARNGGGAIPIRTRRGWLALYHGADTASNRYSMGAMLLDLQEPWRVLAASSRPVLEPEAAYEREGFYPNVVFSCGAVCDGERVDMYYGAADRVVGRATASLTDILSALE